MLNRSWRRTSLLMLVPGLILYGAFVVVAGAFSVYNSFTDWDGLSFVGHWIGLDNYIFVVGRARSQNALKNTLIMATLIVVGQVGVGTLLALVLRRRFPGRNLARAIFFFPILLSPLVVAYAWQYVFTRDGLANDLISRVSHVFGGQDVHLGWLGDISLAKYCIVAMVVWQGAGVIMIIVSAGIESIPSETLEAAEVDGAGPLRIVRSIILPQILPALVISIVLSSIGAFKLFDQVYATTNGGPAQSTETVSTIMYSQAFMDGAFGLASATAVLLTLITAVVAVIQVTVLNRRRQ